MLVSRPYTPQVSPKFGFGSGLNGVAADMNVMAGMLGKNPQNTQWSDVKTGIAQVLSGQKTLDSGSEMMFRVFMTEIPCAKTASTNDLLTVISNVIDAKGPTFRQNQSITRQEVADGLAGLKK